jgi:hypothetical protein
VRPYACGVFLPPATSPYPPPPISLPQGTLHCSWNQPICWFATGVGGNYVQDAILAVNTATGQTLYRHELPAGIYIDNLAYDYVTETLYSIAFRPDGAPGGYAANLVSYDGHTGNVTIVADLSRDFRNGRLYPGGFSICPTDKTMFIGIDADDGEFSDFIAEYEYFSPNGPRFVGAKPLLFPIPSTIHAVCSNRSLEGIYAVTIQSDSQDRETALVGDVNVFGREGLFVPNVKGDLPVLPNNQPLYLTGMMTDFLGLVSFFFGVRAKKSSARPKSAPATRSISHPSHKPPHQTGDDPCLLPLPARRAHPLRRAVDD